MTERTGVVLAGGYSTRFGEQDKALAPVAGEPMLVRVVTRLSDAVDSLVVNCRGDQRQAFPSVLDGVAPRTPIRFALDSTPDRGPLAGILSAFKGIEGEYAAVVACDMPGVDTVFLSALFERAAGHDAAVPEREDGTLQPVQAVYRVDSMRTIASELLAADRRSLHAALDELDTVVVSAADVAALTDPWTLTDVNTTTERDAFERNYL